MDFLWHPTPPPPPIAPYHQFDPPPNRWRCLWMAPFNKTFSISFFHISHPWHDIQQIIVHRFTRIYPVCSTYELKKQFMWICGVKNCTIDLKKNNLYFRVTSLEQLSVAELKEKYFLDLTFTDVHMGRQKVPKSDFQSQFSMSKNVRIFLKNISLNNINLGPHFL